MNKVGSLKNKKSQEEIVGFVVVIVLIAVIALVFLGLSLTKKQEPIESRQVSNLLGAMLQYTTDCSVYKPAYETFRDLAKSCYEGMQCSSGIPACQGLKETAEKMLNAAMPNMGIDRPVSAYHLNISYSTTQSTFGMKQQADILALSKGKCSGNNLSAKELGPLDAGDIEIVLKFCY